MLKQLGYQEQATMVVFETPGQPQGEKMQNAAGDHLQEFEIIPIGFFLLFLFHSLKKRFQF